MLPAKVIGRVVSTQKVPSLTGVKFLLIQPTTWDGKPDGDPLIAADAVSAGWKEFVFYVQAREAAVAFPEIPPLDATVVGIIDYVQLGKEFYEEVV